MIIFYSILRHTKKLIYIMTDQSNYKDTFQLLSEMNALSLLRYWGRAQVWQSVGPGPSQDWQWRWHAWHVNWLAWRKVLGGQSESPVTPHIMVLGSRARPFTHRVHWVGSGPIHNAHVWWHSRVTRKQFWLILQNAVCHVCNLPLDMS